MNVVERVTVLRGVELFAGTPGRVLAGLAAIAEEITLEPGTTLLEQGEVGQTLYIVVSGDLVAEIGGKTVGTLGPGSVAGELAVFVPEPRSATVRSATRAHLLSIEKSAVDELLLDHPEVAQSVIVALVRKFQNTNRLLAQTST